MNTPHPDAALIARLGGSSHLARVLGYDTRAGGAQRVNNWTRRGIPEIIMLRRPDIFGVAHLPHHTGIAP